MKIPSEIKHPLLLETLFRASIFNVELKNIFLAYHNEVFEQKSKSLVRCEALRRSSRSLLPFMLSIPPSVLAAAATTEL